MNARLGKRAALGLGLLLATASLGALSGCNMGQYEEPAFTATTVGEGIEQRDYAPVIAAEVEVSGERKEAVRQGFRLIADYIFGNNAPKVSIAMTAPVIQQSTGKQAGEEIAMTAPVIQQREGTRWKVQFIMPAHYTLKTLPEPVNKAVRLREVKARRMVAVRFSGGTDDENIATHTAQLRAYVAAHHLKTVGEPVLAFYDPPWTLPFFRRNEVMLELRR